MDSHKDNRTTPAAEEETSAPEITFEGASGPSAGTLELERQLKETDARLTSALSLLEQAERMAAVGRLAAEIAHEIKTPLAGICSNNDILARSIQRLKDCTISHGLAPETGSEWQDLFSIMNDALRINRLACDWILKIIQGLRGAAQADPAEPTKENINELIESALSLLGHELGRRIRLFRDFGSNLEIECHPGRLIQVFLNVLVNAIQAIEGEGEIRIRTWLEGGAIHTAISDNGKGIPPELQSKIFESGFTTKSEEGGSGLGLFICRRIVHQHGGRIDVESLPGNGATFFIVLPTHQANERKAND